MPCVHLQIFEALSSGRGISHFIPTSRGTAGTNKGKLEKQITALSQEKKNLGSV